MTTHDDVRSAIESHNTDAVRWYAAGDIDSLAALFAEDAWQLPQHGPALAGRAAIRAFWSEAVKWGNWLFTLETQSVEASGAMAVERGKYSLKFKAGAGAPPGMGSFEDRGNYLVHWRKELDDEWRVVADAPVSELPLPGASVGAA